MMADHRRYRYETEAETYSAAGFWNSASANQPQIGYPHQNYTQQQPAQYYQVAATDSHHHQQTDPYHNHQVIPLSPPSSRPVSVSPDENSLAVSSDGSGHLMPLYPTGRPSFHNQSQSYANNNAIKPDPDCEDQRQHYFQHRHHNMNLEKVMIDR